jgi:sigma-E factor negative regulatory protein RseB
VPVRGGDPAGWIERIGRAAQQHNYAGTWVYSAADVVSSTRVARFGVRDQVYERVEALDGVQQRSFRHNDVIHTVWPGARVVTVEQLTAHDQPAGLPQLDPRLRSVYEVTMLGRDRIAGRSAAVLMLRPRDTHRFAQRLWADKDTGLMLRADVLSEQGQLLESSAFSDVDIDARVTRDQLLNPVRGLEGYRLVQVRKVSTSLEAQGWSFERVPAGFTLVGCVQRPVGEPTEVANGGTPSALQVVFSDGLARVSVFIEAADPAHPRKALMTKLGATHTLIKPRPDGWWITLIGDVPISTLKAFFDATVRKP